MRGLWSTGSRTSRAFDLRYDIPSECARLLHAHETDLGLIPSIEYLRGPAPYWMVPGPAVTSRGPVASVAIYTRREPRDIRTIAMDTSSRTSVALATVMLRRRFDVAPEPAPMAPDLDAMLDAGRRRADHRRRGAVPRSRGGGRREDRSRRGMDGDDRAAVRLRLLDRLARRRRAATTSPRCSGRATPAWRSRTPWRRPTIRTTRPGRRWPGATCAIISSTSSASDEIEGLKTFYRYASELDLVTFDGTLRFYDAEHPDAR